MHGGCVYCSHGDCPRIYHYGFTRFGKPDTTMRRERERGDSKGPQCHLLAGLHCMFAQHYPNCVLPSHWWITKTLNKISCVSLAHFFWYIKPCSLMFPRFSHVFSMCSYVFPMFPMFSIVFPCVLQVFQRFFSVFWCFFLAPVGPCAQMWRPVPALQRPARGAAGAGPCACWRTKRGRWCQKCKSEKHVIWLFNEYIMVNDGKCQRRINNPPHKVRYTL